MRLKLKIENILYRFSSKRIALELNNSSYLRLFDSELALVNFIRLKYLSYIGFLFVAFLLYTDFYLGNFWEAQQISSYIVLDVICAVVTLVVFLATHINTPKSHEQINIWHRFFVNVFIIYFLCWCAAVSAIESTTTGGFPTFLIGIFTASILFIFRKQQMLFAIVSSLSVLVGSLIYLGQTPTEIFKDFYSLIALVVLAIFISKILLYTRTNSFIARIHLEMVNQSLDKAVQERTKELVKTNERLNQEIIERKRHERSLIKAKKRAEESDRLKSAFLGNISHEIRTPLNGILGFGELLLGQPDVSDKQKRFLKIINDNSKQLLHIIENLLDISSIETDQLDLIFVKFNLEVILDSVHIAIINFCKEKGLTEIEINRVDKEQIANYELYSDHVRVQQVLYNLLVNAIKFTEKGTVTYGCEQKKEAMLFYVEDTGIGINEEQAAFIFDPFRQVDESVTRTYGGNGLGLSISKGIIDKLGGKIWHDKTYTNGARFYFTIPTNTQQENSLSQKESVSS